MIIDVGKVIEIQKFCVAEWHDKISLTQNDRPWNYIEENHKWNFSLWHEEDIARIKEIEPERVVLAKRNIDKYNQARNNAMEAIDEWVLEFLGDVNISNNKIELHSETPGMMIDRLSIMCLKLYHMEEEVNREDADESHRMKCTNKVAILKEQIGDLTSCLEAVFKKLSNGQLKFKVYRQLKMYNDPSLNPELYKRSK